MKRSLFRSTVRLAVALLVICGPAPLAVAHADDASGVVRPNVLIVLADDFGWGDMSLHGGQTPTPALDQFFRESVELTQFMVNPVCSPTRASLLTGRHSLALRVGPQVGHHLQPHELTLGQAFQRAGYRTGMFGKWDPADEPDDALWLETARQAGINSNSKAKQKGVNAFGWDQSTAFYTGGIHGQTKRTYAERVVSWWKNDVYTPQEEGFASDLLLRDAMAFMKGERSKPFLCYLPLPLIHGPLTPQPEMLARVPDHVTEPNARAYWAYILHLDEVMERLDQLLIDEQLKEKTVTLFFSDNGATPDGNNQPFRGGKHSIFEGGVHVPAAIRYPAGLKRTGQYAGLMGMLDVMPTLSAICSVPAKAGIDGRNLWPALLDHSPSPVESYYWYWKDQEAVRTDRWKLFTRLSKNELYDLQSDIGETQDVASQHPEVVQELIGLRDRWREKTDVALSSQPCQKDFANEPARPSGEVLEIRVTQKEALKNNQLWILPIATGGHSLLADDWLEFDLLVADESISHGFFISPVKRDKPLFAPGIGVDQFGRYQAEGPACRVPGQWEHRVVGLASEAPLAMGNQIAVVWRNSKPGVYRLYLDNLRIRRGDGTFVPYWSDRHGSRNLKPAEHPAFVESSVRVVSDPP